MSDELKERQVKTKEEADKMKDTIESAVQEAVRKQAEQKQSEDPAKEVCNPAVDAVTKAETVKRQLEQMRELQYDLAALKGAIHKTPVRSQFISPRPRSTSKKTPTKKTSAANGARTSRIRKALHTSKDPRRSAVRTSARRRILQGKQIMENMLNALQMEDLKQLCNKHNVKYRGMPQTRVALRKVPGVVVSITEDLHEQETMVKKSMGEAMTRIRPGRLKTQRRRTITTKLLRKLKSPLGRMLQGISNQHSGSKCRLQPFRIYRLQLCVI
ncbi:hypothetical protein CBR_g2923 [Chara braunii]|uniref:Uncharacterized protein n=1 Tax=Chara braunii TaxID=69332 RepID=A0A388KE96_CHABU|nr:hypothetical protein CBR_g2923 [Chara braunii]|eukprot:GBG68380.1 hypothetical protein CBR_g2923 [Chara braunii]